MSNLVTHAERELRRAGLFDKDSDYDGMIGPAVMELIDAFAGKGHSGYSAMLTLDIFNKLARFKMLIALTSNPDEWMHIADEVAGQPNVWQSTRQSSCFSNDGGKTYYDIDAGDERALHTSAEPVANGAV